MPRSLRGIRAGAVPGAEGWPGSSSGDTGSGSGPRIRRALAAVRVHEASRSLGGPSTRRSTWRRVQARRVAAATLAGVATWVVVSAVLPHPVDVGVPVVVVAHDLATGTRVGAGDVRLELRPTAQRPVSAVSDVAVAVGQVVAGPVGAGELLTTTRFRGPASLAGLSPARVAMSIPLVDDGLTPMLRPGDVVSVLAPGTGARVARAVPVVAVGGAAGGAATDVDGAGGLGLGASPTGGSGGRVVLGLTEQEASAAAATMGGPTGLTGFVLTLTGG